jgi:HK97 family phage major capsid protein
MDINEIKTLVEKVSDESASLLTDVRKQLQEQADQLEASGKSAGETKELIDKIGQRINEVEARLDKPLQAVIQQDEYKSPGQKFIEFEGWKSFCERGWHQGGVKFDIPSRELKTTITSSTVGSSTPGILVPQRVPGIVKPPQRRVRVRDLIPFSTTTNNAVEYPQENTFTNAASPQSAEAASKAESALTFTISYANVQTLSHWIPATKQVLEDWGQLQAYIDVRLLDGLDDIEDNELLYGSGSSPHLNGLITQATDFAGTYNVASDTRIDKLNRAITELNANNYVPDGIVMNPVDWRIIQTIKTDAGGANTGEYLLGGPVGNAVPTLWGLPVAITTAMTAGGFLVGQFRGYVQGYDRMDARIDVSSEHYDYFIRNMVAIRAEKRLTIAVYAGAAFRYGDF